MKLAAATVSTCCVPTSRLRRAGQVTVQQAVKAVRGATCLTTAGEGTGTAAGIKDSKCLIRMNPVSKLKIRTTSQAETYQKRKSVSH